MSKPEQQQNSARRQKVYDDLKEFITESDPSLDQVRLMLGKSDRENGLQGDNSLLVSDLFYQSLKDPQGSLKLSTTLAKLGILEVERYADADPDTKGVRLIEKSIFQKYLNIADKIISKRKNKK